MSFWDHMQMWEKMLLVLAAAMMIVLIWGTIKLIYMKVYAKEYMKRVVKGKATMEENQSSTQLNKAGEIPFGIKALEAGIEVEGVVASRPTTPRATFHSLSNLTYMGSDTRDSFSSLASRSSGPAQPLPPFDHNTGSTSVQQAPSVYQSYLDNLDASTLTLQASSSGRTAYSSDEQLPSQLLSDTHIATLAKAEAKAVSAYSPDSLGPHKTVASPDGIRVAQVSSPRPSSRSPSHSERLLSSGDYDEISPISGLSNEEPFVVHIDNLNRPHLTQDCGVTMDQHGDLSLLHSHRLSHAAEVGQLTRREPNQRAFALSQSVGMYGANLVSTHAALPPGYVTHLEQTVSPTGYHLRALSEGAITHTIFSPREADHNNVAYFEVPLAQQTGDSTLYQSGMVRQEIVDPEVVTSKRISRKLMKKNRVSA